MIETGLFLRKLALLCVAVSMASVGFAQRPLSADNKAFQIGVFYGPTPELTTIKQFRWIKQAHVDFIQFVEDAKRQHAVASQKRNLQILDLAARAGLTYYVGDPRVHDGDEGIEAMVRAYKDHPATAGYYIVDEPGPEGLDWPAKAYRAIGSLDPARVPYVNLLPDFVVANYETDYVHRWVERVGADALIYLSFDNYPFLLDGNFRESNFLNLDIIRRAGLKYGVKTSSYLQSVGIQGHYRRPTSAELRFSAYSNLAYGIKNLVWFTYNTPVAQPVEKFTSAIIDSMGKKTDLYKPFAKLNKELKQVGSVLMQLDAVAVYHSGVYNGSGIIPLPDNSFLRLADTTAQFIITDFRDPNTGQRYVMLVNKSLAEIKEIGFWGGGNVKRVAGSKRVALPGRRGGEAQWVSDRFLPGEGKLYEITETKITE